MIAIRVVLVVSLIVAVVHADESHPEHNVRHGIHDKRYGGRGLHGDIHLTGFQGQPYTVPTESGSVYNLISMPSMYMNARITDMTTAQHCIAEASTNALPPRSERECLSYPGSYMTQIAVVSGDDMVTIDATPRGESLIVKINGAIYEWSQLTIAIANATVELDISRSILTFTMKDIRITIHNIDRYLSVSVDILHTEWLLQGRREMIPRNIHSRYANNIAAASLPVIMHGLLGQSINYVIYPGGAVYQGDASEYMVKHLTSHQFRYSLYAPSADIAHVQYP